MSSPMTWGPWGRVPSPSADWAVPGSSWTRAALQGEGVDQEHKSGSSGGQDGMSVHTHAHFMKKMMADICCLWCW